MNTGKYIFAQLIEFLPQRIFDRIVMKFKSFWGTTETAVRIQIYSAITANCMVAIVEHDLKLHRSTYEVLRILSASLLDKTPIKELFTKEPEYAADDGQLTLNFI